MPFLFRYPIISWVVSVSQRLFRADSAKSSLRIIQVTKIEPTNMQKIILGPDGNPIKPDSNLSLPNDVQALIDAKVTAGILQASDRLRDEFTSKQWYLKITVVSMLLAIAGWLYGPAEVKNWTRQFVADHMNKPMLQEAADEAIRTKMADYVEERINPLREQAKDLSSSISTKSSELMDKQALLEKQLHIQQLAISSKTGSRKDYEELQSLANSEISAKVAIKDVEQFYDADRGQLTFRILGDPITSEDPGYSVDEVALLFVTAPDLRAASVNRLSILNRKTCIATLCESLKAEQDLYVIARITRVLQIITKNKFEPLGLQSALAWWDNHSNDPEYKNTYDGLIQASILFDYYHFSPPAPIIQSLIQKLDSTITADPEARYSRCMRGGLLALLGKYEESEREFIEAEKLSADYRWLYFWKSVLRMKQDRIDEAIELLNKALAKSPGLEGFIRTSNYFGQMLENPNIKWPARKN